MLKIEDIVGSIHLEGWQEPIMDAVLAQYGNQMQSALDSLFMEALDEGGFAWTAFSALGASDLDFASMVDPRYAEALEDALTELESAVMEEIAEAVAARTAAAILAAGRNPGEDDQQLENILYHVFSWFIDNAQEDDEVRHRDY